MINWFLGSALEPMSRGSASFAREVKLEAEPPDLRYQAEPENERIISYKLSNL